MIMSAPPAQLDCIIHTMDNDHCVAVWEQTIIHLWRYQPTLRTVTAMSDVCKDLIARKKTGITCLSIVERTSAAPSGPTRDALATWTKECVVHMAEAVIVAEGSGFRSALVRGVGVALTAVMPNKVPFHIVATVEEGAPHLAPHLPANADGAAGLLRAVVKLREYFKAKYPPHV